MGSGMFIDTTRCIGCKACQVACKAWNRLPAEQTDNHGILQNPSDLSYTTYKLVRMREQVINGKVVGKSPNLLDSLAYHAEFWRAGPVFREEQEDIDYINPRAAVVTPAYGLQCLT